MSSLKTIFVVALFLMICESKTAHKNLMLIKCIKDMAAALPTKELSLVFDYDYDEDFINDFIISLFNSGLKAVVYQLDNPKQEASYLNKLLDDMKMRMDGYTSAEYFIFAKKSVAEDILQMISSENLARRNVIFLFFWKGKKISYKFSINIQEAMRICVITSPRYGLFKLGYSQARPDGKNTLDLVNWWTENYGLFQQPLLPKASKVYKNFKGRVFNIPVLHKPPWNFVTYNNDTIEVIGGRDDKLLRLLSSKLNFEYDYFDPPDRSQGSAIINGTMQGVLGLIWQKEVEMFIGDLTVTYERSQVVEFSFLTLADNEAFLTHAPGRLNEALALIRPFQWQVWPAVIVTIFISGPFLYMLILASTEWKITSISKLWDCIWITTSIFLRQSITDCFKVDRVRILIATMYLVSTYVIGDMYSANLTSMFARPAREKPITTLEQLDKAMAFKGYQLLAERHSASHAILENGTGLYKSIWDKMKGQLEYLLDSTEDGMKIVKKEKNFALIGGRETFFYDTRRFGVHYFHLSEKLFTRYSAIALQIGCPFIHNFNEILMRLFEAGVLTKITEDEYQKLKEKQPSKAPKKQTEVGEGKVQKENDTRLKAMSMKTLQGAFYVLIVGYIMAGAALLGENIMKHQMEKPKRTKRTSNAKD
ncbi:ionotropic receptor 40a [Cimex lectularius]|uniref:Ionotropic receptor n=1 Tax=Cimex lectularius TaxID=79782 RepID=A0A8I6RE65_CIMLE|nr:ionotropic receptor 40a [Cimex lectularius]